MVVAYVRLYPSLAPSATAARRMEPSKRLHALVLPSALDEADWAEVQTQRSAFAGGCGFSLKSVHRSVCATPCARGGDGMAGGLRDSCGGVGGTK